MKDWALKYHERFHQIKEGLHGYLKAILLHGAGQARRQLVLWEDFQIVCLVEEAVQ